MAPDVAFFQEADRVVLVKSEDGMVNILTEPA